jgi:hypothetical protein
MGIFITVRESKTKWTTILSKAVGKCMGPTVLEMGEKIDMYIFLCMYVYVCITCVCVHVYVCTYVCMYAYRSVCNFLCKIYEMCMWIGRICVKIYRICVKVCVCVNIHGVCVENMWNLHYVWGICVWICKMCVWIYGFFLKLCRSLGNLSQNMRYLCQILCKIFLNFVRFV